MGNIGKKIKKIDSEAITLGKPIYTEDLAIKNTLCVKLLRSPHANAIIKSIDKSRAERTVGVEGVFTYEDVPKNRFCMAGQTYPELSPYDRLLLDKHVRYVGDPVAIVVAADEKICNRALNLIKVKYEVLEPLLDFEKSETSHIKVHSEEDGTFFKGSKDFVKYDLSKNIVGEINKVFGEDPEKTFEDSPVKIEEEYTMQEQAHSMMETYRSYSYYDHLMRLTVITSTQVPFHIKRQLSVALGIPASKIRIIKPRIGGGFGGKQTSVTEIYAAFATMKTGKPCMIKLSRKENYIASNTRHKMKVKVKIGAEEDGRINVIDLDALSDQGAYGEHGFTTLGLVGDKSLPLYNKLKSARFHGKVVYTNKVPGGAFRGYGATQGCFAVESAVNELAKKINMDPSKLRLKNITKEGETTLAYNQNILSSKLEECILKGRKLIGWEEKYPSKVLSNGNIRSVGMAITMQGSGIANIDTSTVNIKLNEEGDFSLLISATDNGAGADTVLSQMAAEILKCNIDDIITISADTDITPYDPGSYASSGVYVTGGAVVRAANKLKRNILKEASEKTGIYFGDMDLNKGMIMTNTGKEVMSLKDLAEELSSGAEGKTIMGSGSFGSDTSPPPYVAGFAELETDILTGQVKVVNYVAVVDCGTVINENLARVQVEGGVVQGIGLALYEDVVYSKEGRLLTDEFLQYKIPTRKDIGELTIDFQESYEPTGPFGAKSIGEVVINTPAPAINGALLNGIGTQFSKLPIKAEHVLKKIIGY
ncbi:xanthine dehydrogenase family protein molybdopterin-binding subunit [Miniphocaeibacter halophilus]|uniref:Molybdopterin-dependent oxidoreductase n=1 Tax=Miniphocaeibacter halophilus TaxID=2931922 RepID=A0AC61MTJ1_9FIRM|nr:molybdopterin cofactor-binding domain-containing protein [Miniphocaeibacter halophilus]QQK08852.1 molybdopterin-dependent oxidoreductase [Miniphocaeibacter halophilus]